MCSATVETFSIKSLAARTVFLGVHQRPTILSTVDYKTRNKLEQLRYYRMRAKIRAPVVDTSILMSQILGKR